MGGAISRALGFVLFLYSLWGAATLTAQSSSQQYVYANVPSTPPAPAAIPAFAKSGQTGALSPVLGSPFPDRLEGGRMAVDALGRFLFVLNPTANSISMFQIDSSTGALTEVPTSPFAAGKTINRNQAPSLPVSLATEKSGKYLYVGYTGGNFSNSSAITPFAIDTANLQLTLTDQLSFDVSFNPLQMFSDPRGLFLYILQGLNPFTEAQNGGANVYSITPTDGSLVFSGSAGSGSQGRAMASDPQGRCFYEGTGQFQGFVFWGAISALDGTSNPGSQFLPLGEDNFPDSMFVESSGKFLYVQQSAGLVIYSIDQTTGQPTPLTAPLASPIFQLGNVVADPAGPFLYAGSAAGIRVYQVSAADGSLSEISGSPFSTSGSAMNIAISGTTVQAISGLSAAFTPAPLNFGSVTEGQPIGLILHLVNNGDQTLTINLLATTITGPNAADFSQSTTCQATLAPNANCTFSVTFSPATATVESATLQITDNAPASPQSIALTGTGVARNPSLAFIPGSLTFNPIAQGATEGPQPIQITNVGSATLHVSNVALGGSNPQDFSAANTCNGTPIAVNASCAINISFTPSATGSRSASITVTDDAPNSPQTLFVEGSGTVAFQLNSSPQSSTTASVMAGQTAQYSLQISPGTGFNGNVAVSCSGLPLATSCSFAPATISVASSNPVSFTTKITTSGSASNASIFVANNEINSRVTQRPFVVFAVLGLLLIWIGIAKNHWPVPMRAAAGCLLLLACIVSAGISGCGGASNVITPPPQQLITPKGNYVITVTASAGALPPQTISLTLTVN
jgi:hypothetical protein